MAKKDKIYLTEQKVEEIKKEYEELKKLKQHKAQEGVPRVLHSDEVNPEYLSYHEDVNLLEKRMAELDNILRNFEIIQPPPKGKRDKVKLGATVVVKDKEKERDEFEIVGSIEADPFSGKISDESPVGKALLGAKVGDIITVPLEAIRNTYKIITIKYNDFSLKEFLRISKLSSKKKKKK